MYNINNYKPIIGFEGLYELNRDGDINELPREVNYMGKKAMLKRCAPVISFMGNSTYAILKDSNLKNRKVNITKMIKNLFGRQKPLGKQPRELCGGLKPINYKGAAGYAVEQIDNGGVIKVFPTMAAAARAVGGEPRHISDCAYGKRHFYAGYKWRFKK